ncbi:MAG: nucleoside monophosphate kinase [Patescibacteria group bacterium]
MTPDSPALNFIFINGKGSGGKDTQANLLLETIPNSIRLSTGDIYRGAKSQQGEYAGFFSRIEPYIEAVDKQGALIPDEVIFPMVETVIEKNAEKGITTFIFTGFPRTIPQLDSTDKLMESLRQRHAVETSFACIAILDEHSRKRAGGRYESALRENTKPRPDDIPETVEKRLEIYRKNTSLMLHKLAREGRLVVIKGSEGIQEVWRRTKERLESPTSRPSKEKN